MEIFIYYLYFPTSMQTYRVQNITLVEVNYIVIQKEGKGRWGGMGLGQRVGGIMTPVEINQAPSVSQWLQDIMLFQKAGKRSGGSEFLQKFFRAWQPLKTYLKTSFCQTPNLFSSFPFFFFLMLCFHSWSLCSSKAPTWPFEYFCKYSVRRAYRDPFLFWCIIPQNIFVRVDLLKKNAQILSLSFQI